MDHLIKTIEDLSLNAWPSHQIQIYDGWLLRFSYFYTHRTNCVEQIGASALPLSEKVPYCENIYRAWGTPCIFKISPLLQPSFDAYLEEAGYQVEHRTGNMILQDIGRTSPKASPDVEISHFISSSWIDALFALKGTTNVMHKRVVPSMYAAIPKETICASVRADGRQIATGLGILDRDFIGIYAIHVHPDFRRQGIARAVVETLLARGHEKGAAHAYLQVVEDNLPAVSLYSSLGFQQYYTDWFRVRRLL